MQELSKVPNFDMEALKTFFLVVKCRSFSEAAEMLHKTPATVSYRIKSLEDQVGLPLLKRSTRNVELLPAGEHLMEFATEIYGLLQTIPKHLQQISAGAEMQFSIVVNNLLYDPAATISLLEVLKERFPYTQFEFKLAVYMGVWDEIISKTAHFAIGVPTWHPFSNDTATSPLGLLHWTFVLPPKHPLSKKNGPLTTPELLEYPAINIVDTAVAVDKRISWRIPGQRELIVPDMETKLLAHLNGLGVGFLPEPIARPYIQTGKLVTHRIEYPRQPSPMAIAWQIEKRGAVSEFLEELFKSKHPAVKGFFSTLDTTPLAAAAAMW